MGGVRSPRAAWVALALSVVWAGGCGDSRCEPLCRTLVSSPEEGGCGFTTWDAQSRCEDGCQAEILGARDPDGWLTCFEAAAAECDEIGVFRCRLQEGR